MDVREHCNGSMQLLQENLFRFSLAAHDVNDPNGTWNDIRLNADSLTLDFATALVLEGSVDSEFRSAVAALLQQAVDIMPPDVDPCVVEKMQNHIADVLLATTEDI